MWYARYVLILKITTSHYARCRSGDMVVLLLLLASGVWINNRDGNTIRFADMNIFAFLFFYRFANIPGISWVDNIPWWINNPLNRLTWRLPIPIYLKIDRILIPFDELVFLRLWSCRGWLTQLLVLKLLPGFDFSWFHIVKHSSGSLPRGRIANILFNF